VASRKRKSKEMAVDELDTNKRNRAHGPSDLKADQKQTSGPRI
jgi:hypothetical protein